MALQRFDHINVRTTDIDAARDFFIDVLGLVQGARPPFGFPGYWMYHGSQAVIHISGASASATKGWVDHLAFRCEGYAQTMSRLRELGLRFHETNVPAGNDRQVFVEGPGGITLELLFAAADVAAVAKAASAV